MVFPFGSLVVSLLLFASYVYSVGSFAPHLFLEHVPRDFLKGVLGCKVGDPNRVPRFPTNDFLVQDSRKETAILKVCSLEFRT